MFRVTLGLLNDVVEVPVILPSSYDMKHVKLITNVVIREI
jgi:hypothetical protein